MIKITMRARESLLWLRRIYGSTCRIHSARRLLLAMTCSMAVSCGMTAVDAIACLAEVQRYDEGDDSGRLRARPERGFSRVLELGARRLERRRRVRRVGRVGPERRHVREHDRR